MTFVLTLFGGRLIQLQGLESKEFVKYAAEQRVKSIPLLAPRGAITDSRGRPLAMTVDAKEIAADPALVPAAHKVRVAETLAALLGLDPAEVYAKLTRADTRYVTIARGVSPEDARTILALRGFTGIIAKDEYRRVYPSGRLAANILGHVGMEGHGLAGLEAALDKVIAGAKGRRLVEVARDGQPIPMTGTGWKKPVPGRNVRLTIDADIQWVAQQAIERKVRATRALSGSVTVMDVRSGQVLALATAPGFDPGDWQRAPAEDRGNRAVTEVFEPGSTNKVITAAAALEVGGVRPDTPFTVPYRIRRADVAIRDAHQHATQRLTFAGVLAQSSNTGIVQAAERVGDQRLYHFLSQFGFGRPSGLDFPGESRGLLPKPAQWLGSQRYTIPFGQGVSATAIQMASVYQTIANGGVRVAPTLVAGIEDADGTFTPGRRPAQRRVISTRTAQELTRMLEGVISARGTAPQARIPGYRVAGKTGTALRINDACGCYRGGGYTASFAGFAPADDPKLMVQVVLQRPLRGHYGGVVAAPVFSEVMAFGLKSRKIPPTGTKPPKIRIYAKS